MFNSNTTFIGIDPTAGEKPFVYAALDHNLQMLALGHGSIDDVLAFAAGQRHAFVGVCAPRQPNQGVMSRPEIRQLLSPPPNPGRWSNFRLADYLLRQHNLSIPQTPSDESQAPNWMRNGFALFNRLQKLGYCTYPEAGADRQDLEVYPYAGYAVMLGILPFPKHTLEGRLQRQLALYERDVDVPDAMRIFEEITRHRLLKGLLPLDLLYTSGELDALVAAYTARQAALHADMVTLLGDPQEGQVVLPGVELKLRY